ncbi:MAG TPA: beta-ketoacyl-[acyl-carrier-protein] synthase family protein [Planctomycetes bacterium]|nr:beta-ketoacyl-[acyl-carrier-protein] synthase family protein [Planctomycetota bacterium]HIJ71663.1 beta-ketoacyl-[acyl-carrier-protein] synthase family protein [Planctomycetota bacterium]
MKGRRVVITGLGAISPLGLTADDLWSGLMSARCGIDFIKAFDPAGFSCKLAGEAPEFKVQKYVPKSYRKAVKLMSRDIELSVVAADEAVRSSGLVTKATEQAGVNISPWRMAINLGAGVISCDLVELAFAVAKSITDGRFDIHKWGSDGLENLTPIWLLKYLPNMPACHVGIIHDIQGPSNTLTCGEASGHLAISEAAEIISRGDADAALAGGCEAKVNPIIMLRQCLLKRATSPSNDNPDAACRPFDANAQGCVFGEGAGVVVLEELDSAVGRGAKIYAEVVGTGSSNNLSGAYEHQEASGAGIQIAIETALADAGISPAQLDLIIPHGTGILADDLAEATAIQKVLGPAIRDVPVWPTKSMLSNTGAASGALDLIAAARAVDEGKIGAAKNCDNKAPGCELNITEQILEKDIRFALCCSYTFGGQTAAVVLKSFDGFAPNNQKVNMLY